MACHAIATMKPKTVRNSRAYQSQNKPNSNSFVAGQKLEVKAIGEGQRNFGAAALCEIDQLEFGHGFGWPELREACLQLHRPGKSRVVLYV
jgi:hypothetical protein